MSDDESPPKLSTLGMRVLTRIVRELASADGFDYASADAERRNHSIFSGDIYDEHSRNFLVSSYGSNRIIDGDEFSRVIVELIENKYIFYKNTLDGLTVTLNPACVTLEDVRQKIYKEHKPY